MPDSHFDVLIIGGSLGGCAAALAAARHGASVCLIEASDWLGGQFTAQGVTKPDENAYVETTGSTRTYRAFRTAVREYYADRHRLSALGAAQPRLNPGGEFPGFSLEPRVGSDVLAALLAEAPGLQVKMRCAVTGVEMTGGDVLAVVAEDAARQTTRFAATCFLDATDLGELLPHCGERGRDWVLGAEGRGETGEPDAPPEPRPDWIQPITLPFALERRPAGEDHTIPRPVDYDRLRAQQHYGILDGYIDSMFRPGRDMWSYRQFIAAANFDDPAFPYDLTMINTDANDYKGGVIPTGSAEEDARVVDAARQASLGYLYWLQTECPRDEDASRKGYPELKLRADLFGTPDGTAAFPYIRESRRIKALYTVVEQDIGADFQPGPRARLFPDSCGIGLYMMDVHAFPLVGMKGVFRATRPYQIPLRSLIPARIGNLLAACKNLGVTHITNGAYRLHPVEWNTGEAAGALAAFCAARKLSPRAVPGDAVVLAAFQRELLADGVPLYWWSDVLDADPWFAAAHQLGIRGIVDGFDDLSLRADEPVTEEEVRTLAARSGHTLPGTRLTRGQACLWLEKAMGLAG